MIYKVPLSEEQSDAYETTIARESVAVDACAGSGKSHTARAIAKNTNGAVESIPFMRALMLEEQAAYHAHANVNALNFHSRGLRLCGGKSVEVNDYKLTQLSQ